MDDSALKEALQRLLGLGEAAEDSKMMKLAASKKAPAEMPCAECAAMPEGEKCEACMAKDGGEDEGELAGLLEQGAAEG